MDFTKFSIDIAKKFHSVTPCKYENIEGSFNKSEIHQNSIKDLSNRLKKYLDNKEINMSSNDIEYLNLDDIKLHDNMENDKRYFTIEERLNSFLKSKELFNDIENDLENHENLEKKGGSYGEVFKKGEGEKFEVHHMPANNVNGLELNDGPAIKMEKEDHRETASCGNSREARQYRLIQKDLIEEGKFREAMQMDIDDIHEKFADKYDDAISQMVEYVDKIQLEGKI